jgi:hypothetical protein
MPVPTQKNQVALLQRQAWRIPIEWIDFYKSVTRPGLAVARLSVPEDNEARAFVYSDAVVYLGRSTKKPRATHNCASLEEAVQFVNTLYELGEL